MKNIILLITLCSLLGTGFAQAQRKNGGIIVYENQGVGLLAAPKDLGLPHTYKQSIEKCEEYVLNGFDNWRLPTKSELNLLYEKRNVIGGFDMNYVYWSSTTDGSVNTAWYIDFADGEKAYGRYDYGTGPVRCVRSFNSQEKELTIAPQTKQLTLDSINMAFINGLNDANIPLADYTQVQGIYKNPMPLGDGDNPQYIFYIVTQNGVVLRAFGTDLTGAFCAFTGEDKKRIVLSTKSKLAMGHISKLKCLLSGDKIVFKDNYDEIDNWHLDRSTHSLIWDGGFRSNGQAKQYYNQSLNFIAPISKSGAPSVTSTPTAAPTVAPTPSENNTSNTRESEILYLLINKDVAKAGLNAWNHYQIYGKNEGRIWPNLTKTNTPVNNEINAKLYLLLNKDVAKAGLNAWNHYQIYGKNEGRIWPNLKIVLDNNPSNCSISSTMYLLLFNDVAEAGLNAWSHYQSYGKNEGRIWPGCSSTF
jgi:hypothetical protein